MDTATYATRKATGQCVSCPRRADVMHVRCVRCSQREARRMRATYQPTARQQRRRKAYRTTPTGKVVRYGRTEVLHGAHA
jgi:hypothetical protein